MVALLRAVTTSNIYRQIRCRLQSREPDDVWYDPNVGWILTFVLVGPGEQHLALFVVRQPEPGVPATLLRAMEVSRDDERATTETRLLEST